MDHKNYNNVTKPKHYQFSEPCIEVRDVIRDRLDRCIKWPVNSKILYDYSNAIKYLLRWFEKNGTEDLRKAKYCIDSMLSILEDGKDSTDQPIECEPSDDVPTLDLTDLRKALDDYHKSNIIGVHNTPCQPL
jgi:hypothetical protein